MSDFEMVNELPEKPIQYTIDRVYMGRMESEIDKLLKIMAEQDKAFKEQGKKPIQIEYDENGYIVVDINDNRQMKLWSE
ncbi:hypothetical protein [Oceanobacillus neutriphilus]|uniref:Uncharacterized protein n=1 Tax=Oceanobacillus neutriphilus TaxID=531815 RepID=A0ABQ2NSN4_9BACI|nr:hypothetical protein [Oceanobacillus neutriphilus]GGP09833.1 hypothetical protein GCM10011346_15520 [Oceanobacillus neutriphilus]